MSDPARTEEPAIDRVGRRVAERYTADERLLSFGQLLDRFHRDPYPHSRSTVQYLRDAIRSFGRTEVPGIGGNVSRWRIFDAPWDRGEGAVVGHESAQRALVELIEGAARDGRLDRMIVLHGPNGSGKSSFIEILLRGLEEYSHHPEGALYALRWIFPKAPPEATGLGFGRSRAEDDRETYALLGPDDVAGRVVCELKCNPLHVIPDSERPQVLAEALARRPDRRSESYRRLLHGNLCPKCKAIYEGLLAGNHGDWKKVVRHVQVERIYVSRRFRIGAVVTQPQGTPDAGLQQIAGGSAAAGLPPILHATPLFEALGDLPDANRGLLEFSDFLKRSLEMSKYLLQTTERGFVTVGNQLLDLDVVFLATVNERHLEAFRSTPDYPSFQGRMHFVRVPYLRELPKEERIYEVLCRELARGGHVAPHVARTLAFFAVLTRLERPRRENHEGRARSLVSDLTPVEKLWLFADGRLPARLDADDARVVRAALPVLRDEQDRESRYEGRVGASVRDLRSWLVQASVRRDVGCLTPGVVVDALRDVIRQKETYRFLQVEAEGEYHDAEAHVRTTLAELCGWVVTDVQTAMQVVSEDEQRRRFDLYFQHVVAQVRGESVRDPSTGRPVPPDDAMMENVERLFRAQGSASAFRTSVVSRIGAWAVDHPADRPLDFRRIFPDLDRAMNQAFFDQRREAVRRVMRHLLVAGTPDFDALPEADRELAATTLRNLTGRAGWCPACIRDGVDLALRHGTT